MINTAGAAHPPPHSSTCPGFAAQTSKWGEAMTGTQVTFVPREEPPGTSEEPTPFVLPLPRKAGLGEAPRVT